MPKNNTTNRIIAINPGVRYLAIAIFDGTELREWRMKCLSGQDIKKKSDKAIGILAGFIERYQPVVLAIKKLHASRSSAGLDLMTANITEYCQSQGLKIYSYSISKLEKALLSCTKTNKKELAKLLVTLYPELAPELKREENNRNAYFVRLFEAVALGHICLSEILNLQKR